MIVSIEQHVDWITDCMAYMRDNGLDSMEAAADAEDKWVARRQRGRLHHALPAGQFLVHGRQRPRQAADFHAYIGGVGPYRQICNDVAAKGYEGFVMERVEPVQKRAASS
jgi:cyclohexanone monooxygenase